jgi:hypothetical protein
MQAESADADSVKPSESHAPAAAAPEPTIYVAISSYCDPLLWNTVRECWRMAERPDRLRFGIVDQGETPARTALAELPFADQVRYVFFDKHDARGPCWARAIGFSLYGNEDYLLQLDSHMIFDQGWDRILKDQLESLAPQNRKTVLSTYPWGFEIRDGEFRRCIGEAGVLAIRPMKHCTLTETSPILEFKSMPIPGSAPLPGYHISGNFLFTRGGFVDEVPYDPQLYFHGEEQNLAIRAYTHGWDIYHPVSVPLYHLYRQPEQFEQGKHRPLHWDPAEDERRKTRWWQLHEAARERMRRLLYGEGIQGAYGLGRVRTLADFAAFSGIDYIKRTVAESI